VIRLEAFVDPVKNCQFGQPLQFRDVHVPSCLHLMLRRLTLDLVAAIRSDVCLLMSA
jgi:hypothetical protein